MSLVPAWAPNLHPVLVHFPVAVLTAAVAVDLADLAARRRTGLGVIATWLYISGAWLAMVAYFSGDRAARTTEIPLDALAVLEAHRVWAFRATWSFMFFASLRLLLSYGPKPPTSRLRLVALGLALCGLGSLAAAVGHGSQLVFDHGIGVDRFAAGAREMPE